ncbi:MAG: saccharopine dehydrogenase C-terminal domain-containing protein [Candidatus Nezhaarchaeales archaeon]
MRFLVVGYGRVGRAVALDLKSRGHHVEAIDVATRHDEIIDELHVIDVSKDVSKASKLAAEFDCTCGCLPGKLGYKFMESCAERGVKLVDVSFMSEDPMLLDSKARKEGSIIIPDCGVAPGLSNMIVGLSAEMLDYVDSVEIRVGGLPLNPKPPFYHSLSWSIDDLLEEYTRPARYVENGVVKICDPLSFRTTIRIGDWELEAFPTDGLRTLLRMRNRPNSLRELTLRWKGHLDAISLLRALDLLSEEEVEIQGVRVPIKALTAKIFEKCMKNGPDMIIMEVEVQGVKNGSKVRGLLRLYGTAFSNDLSTMARVTGAVCSEVALLLCEGRIDGSGVIPPEDLDDLKLIIQQILERFKSFKIHLDLKGLESLGLMLHT